LLSLRHHAWKSIAIHHLFLSRHLHTGHHHERILATKHHVRVLEHLLLAILSIFFIRVDLLLLHHRVEHHVLHATHHSIGIVLVRV
jgi:hypothetical protein